MPKIEYEAKKIKRKFTPEWGKSGIVDLDDVLPKYVAALLLQKKSLVEYIELLHDEIDRLQGHIGRNIKNS